MIRDQNRLRSRASFSTSSPQLQLKYSILGAGCEGHSHAVVRAVHIVAIAISTEVIHFAAAGEMPATEGHIRTVERVFAAIEQLCYAAREVQTGSFSAGKRGDVTVSNGDQLTPRRREILDFIAQTTEERGYPPTVREIGAAVGLKSSSSVHHHLRVLEEQGYISRDGSLTRALRVASDDTEPDRSSTRYLPLVGRVAAGEPILATENIERLVPTSVELFGQGDLFLLEVKGESMVEAGILDGDLVVVSQQPTAEDGEIVVALLEDEATVKYLHRHADRIELRPANVAMEPIFCDDVQLIGRVCGVIRSLR